ncbi:MAG TPA: hypothetical protein VGQ59_10085 [Cyclobacteriaceae bacterium]|jgi:hypothetical protein|nr:hypothetical protein [Cyclobacteriaceae bacterium]
MKTQAKFSENTMQIITQKRSSFIVAGVLVAVVCLFMLLHGNGSLPNATIIPHLVEVKILSSVLTLKTTALKVISALL